jgi:DNA-binding NarL/FixJ family response regulator
VRLVLAVRHTLYRAGLRRLLADQPDFEVVGDAADAEQACRCAVDLHARILLLDLGLPGADVLALLRKCGAQGSTVRVLALGDIAETSKMAAALRLGAWGALAGDATVDALFSSVRAVAADEPWVAPETVAHLLAELHGVSQQDGLSVASRAVARLSAREREIVAEVSDGATNRDVAEKLRITERTVKNHLSTIFDKLGVSSRLELAVFALHHGIGTPPEQPWDRRPEAEPQASARRRRQPVR